MGFLYFTRTGKDVHALRFFSFVVGNEEEPPFLQVAAETSGHADEKRSGETVAENAELQNAFPKIGELKKPLRFIRGDSQPAFRKS